jgi:pimeloyl-ACP methyl ester carboxylesterase
MWESSRMVERPGWQTVAREARAVPEFASFAMAVGPLLAVSPRGDGHAVLVLPGLGGNDASTAPLRWFIGRHVTDGLDQLVAANHENGPVSLVGWSLGGVHAMELARRRPDAVCSVITLGSPLLGRPQPPPDIPTTSVYSRSDAVVGWRASLVRNGELRENVEVRGSHLGLGHNPAVAVVVADRLAQTPETWQPFRPPRWTRPWLPTP